MSRVPLRTVERFGFWFEIQARQFIQGMTDYKPDINVLALEP